MSVRRLVCYVIASGGTLKMSNAINKSLLRIWNIRKTEFHNFSACYENKRGCRMHILDKTKTEIFIVFKLVQGLRWRRTQLKVRKVGHILFGFKCRTSSL